MTTLTKLADEAAAEALAFADLLDETVDRHSPTPCEGWTIDDLAAHVASGIFRDAESFHRARLGTSTPPGELALDSKDFAEAIRLGVDHLRDAVDRGPSPWPTVPMPFGGYPADVALQCLVIEFGVHRNDLAIARGDLQAPFSPATLEAMFGFGELYLLMQAAPMGSGPIGFTVVAPSKTVAISWDGSAWSAGPGDGPQCRITASDDAAARLMLRRLDIFDPQISLDDPAGVADRFADAIRPL
ncbi:maleylpyruvate isomerase family mycothiol-dependent enzyme [Mycobacterium hubeiense]|uniref:maleylpyruvate isomerase family mycothiol-dependent enzyme n=1 Tax=Mycobacterium hubeiense TaxID=1867256 RepID=UPI000C7E91C3|nr:maleylpyruvate isomerase family mycothiol-dependent enzyme [Mycobacterium sp. QGD 101]